MRDKQVRAGFDTRDPELGELTSEKQQPVDFGIWRIGDLWHCYYTAHTGKKGADFCRTSNEARMVAD